MEARQECDEVFQERLPNKYVRGLDALDVGYPGCGKDLSVAREYIEAGSKKLFLKAFRKLKGKQIAYEHYREVSGSNDLNSFELEYPGNELDKRELEHWFDENPPNDKNVEIFRERVEGLRNKNAVFFGDRSHPNIVALLKLQLTYLGCEEDVREALEVHYSRPFSLFPGTLHSLNIKQNLYTGNRSHWRLVKLDDLDLTYPKWQNDIEQVENWHIHNVDNQENAVIFHEVIGGLLEQEELYLGWNHERKHLEEDEDEVEAQNDCYHETETKEAHEKKRRHDSSSIAKYFDAMEEKNKKHLKKVESRSIDSDSDEERREDENENNRFQYE